MRFVVTFFDAQRQTDRVRLCKTLEEAKSFISHSRRYFPARENFKIKVIKFK